MLHEFKKTAVQGKTAVQENKTAVQETKNCSDTFKLKPYQFENPRLGNPRLHALDNAVS